MSDFDPTDAAFWDKSAASYAAQLEPFTALFARDALATAAIGPGTRLLDVATGTGAAAVVASGLGAEVTAIDFSFGMVAQVAALNLPRVTAAVMNGQALDFPDEAFDVGVSVCGVMLFADWRKGLRELARVTRAGGTGIVATWAHAAGAATNLLLSQLWAEMFGESEQPVISEGMNMLCKPKRLTSEMEDAGFEAVSVIEVTHDFQLKIAVLDQVEVSFAAVPHWNRLDEGQRAQMAGALRQRAARDGRDGILRVPSAALVATARRR